MASDIETGRHIVLAFYPDYKEAEKDLQKVMKKDFPLDRVSLLGKASPSGDDPLGVYYSSVGERMKGWGKQGAFWGGLWGMITGAAGIFLFPGVGPVMAAGPVVEAIIAAAGGASIGGGALAGVAAASQLSVAIHRMGVPEKEIDRIQNLINDGYYMLLLIVDNSVATDWRNRLQLNNAEPVMSYPYVGLLDAIRETV